MNIKSEKEFYASELREKAARMEMNIFIWGEELIDRRIIIYPKKLKEVEEYDLIKETLKPCGVVIINTMKKEFLRCSSAMVNTENGNVYFSLGNFNGVWKELRNSVDLGIRMAKERTGSCVISKPEDILMLDYLQRPGSEPVLEKYVIKYVARKLTEEEKYKNSRKQSLIDNHKMLYYYSDTSLYFHDKECGEINKILPDRFRASDSIPVDKKICPHCRRKIFFRTACYPNAKQMPVCDRIFKNHMVSNAWIEHYVMECGMKFHATDFSEMLVEGKEDKWMIKGLDTEKLELWHNNYVKTSPTERYITEGFHDQKVWHYTLGQMLNYVESYSWQKHLQSEGVLENEDKNSFEIAADEVTEVAENVENGCGAKWYKKIWSWLKKIVHICHI